MASETELWEALRSAAHARDEARRAMEASNTAYQEAKDLYERAWHNYYSEIMGEAVRVRVEVSGDL